MKEELKKLNKQIGLGKRRCVCTEEYYCKLCKEIEALEKV